MTEQLSVQWFTLAKNLLPGGVNSPVRACGRVGRVPRFVASAKGDRIVDVDGNEYIDYVGSWGPAILGHAHPEVVAAVKAAAEEGLTFGAPTAREVEMAELVRELVPSMEVSRMVSSGTEAVMSAVRVARGFTGRDDIVKFDGCYHGHSDGMLVRAGSGALTQAEPDSAGVPADFARHTLVAPYNDVAAVETIFKAHPDSIAAVIVEPVAANAGVILPKPGFLKALRELTTRYGALLIFDEVITGFRLALGGAQELFGIRPDLSTFGKIVGGGMPAAVYGGRADVMCKVAPDGPVYQAGTLSGNPLATAAGLATLKILKRDPAIYERLAAKGAKLADAIRAAAGDRAEVAQIGSLLSVFFLEKDAGVANGQDARSTRGGAVCGTGILPVRADEMFARWYSHLLDRGIYVAPSRFEAMFVSDAHTDADIDRTIEVMEEFL